MGRGRGGFGRGAVRTGKRTVNRTIYLFGPIVIFALFLWAWYVYYPSSYNEMIVALRKFFGAWQG